MKIYVTHSSNFDYKNELYIPLRKSSLNTKHEIFLPHETNNFINSKEIIQKSDLIIAEVSYPSTGEGIELGWTEIFKIPIICIYKKGSEPSSSLKTLSKKMISYNNSEDMIKKIEAFLSNKAMEQ